MMNMTIKPKEKFILTPSDFGIYIFNWPRQLKNTLELENRLKEYCPTIINSDERNSLSRWKNLSNDAYLTKQLLTAFEDFLKTDKQIFVHIQSDAFFDDWDSLIQDAIRHYDEFYWGVYAPNVNFTEWNPDRTDIPFTNLNVCNLQLVACTDCTVWMISRDIIQEFFNLSLDLSNQQLGFGMDMTICALSHLNHRPVLRNYAHVVDHPRGTGYNVEQAHRELNEFYQMLPKNLLSIVYSVYRRPSHLTPYHSTYSVLPNTQPITAEKCES